jgi:hypothetical protein
MPHIRGTALATAVPLLALTVLVAATSAAQAGSSGASRFDFHFCDGAFCSDGTTLQNFATTQSGNMVLTYHSTYINTFSDPSCAGRTQERDMTTYLLTPDGTGAYHFTNKGKTTFQCSDGSSVTCRFIYVFTLADNEVRGYKPTVECTPTAAGFTAT